MFDEEEMAGPRQLVAGLRLREIMHVIVFYTELGSRFFNNSGLGSATTQGIGSPEPRPNRLLGVYVFLVLSWLAEQVERGHLS